MAVIIKGKSIGGGQKSRDHYLRGPENEKITVLAVKGFATTDPDEALRMIELSAKGTKCQKPVYSAKINPEPDRVWTREEVERAVDLLEENLGLQGHARVVIEHLKKGRIHYHALWSRFPPDGGATVRMSNDYAAHQKTQKQLQKEFKLKPMMARGRDFKEWEVKWASRYGFDIFKLREQVTKDFNTVKSGQEFKAKLEAQGIVLCRGDKSQFVIILPWGQHKALSSMIHGRPTKAILRRAMGDIDISALPTVDEGKVQVKATLPKLKANTKAKAGAKGKSKDKQCYESGTYTRRGSTAFRTYGNTLTARWMSGTNNAALPHGILPPHYSTAYPQTPERPAPTPPPTGSSLPHMSAAQRTDFLAACEGKITWRQYFQIWGGNGNSPGPGV